MSAIAIAARPRLFGAALLAGVCLLAGHEPRSVPREIVAIGAPVIAVDDLVPLPHLTDGVFVPPAFADAEDWPRGMVIRPGDPGDRMPTGARSLATVVTGLLRALISAGA